MHKYVLSFRRQEEPGLFDDLRDEYTDAVPFVYEGITPAHAELRKLYDKAVVAVASLGELARTNNGYNPEEYFVFAGHQFHYTLFHYYHFDRRISYNKPRILPLAKWFSASAGKETQVTPPVYNQNVKY